MTNSRTRGCGATHCYGCACDTCANSVELLSWYVTIGEAVEPCFICDDCRHYDGDLRKRSQWHDATCPRYIEAKKAREARAQQEEKRAQQEEKRAQAIRATFKVIKGGRDHV